MKRHEMTQEQLRILAGCEWEEMADCRLDCVVMIQNKKYHLFYNADEKECAVFANGEVIALAHRSYISPVVLTETLHLIWHDYQWYIAQVMPLTGDMTKPYTQKE